MSMLSKWLAAAPPDAVVEIAPEGVSVATLGMRGSDAIIQAYAVEPLAPGVVLPSLVVHNIHDKPAVAAALGAACDKAGIRPKRVALLIPDPSARVSLLRFDSVPDRREDLDQLIAWQLRKSAPFPIEEGVVSYSPGAALAGGGREFVVELARQDIVREYEGVCEAQGMHAGLVDLSTLSVVNLFLSDAAAPASTALASTAPAGDWLVVHMRPLYTSIALMRGEDLIFFRSRAEGEEELLEDVVHQTAMYYEDRLEGRGFARVFLGGVGRPAESGGVSLEAVQRSLESRLGARVEPIDPTRVAALTDRIGMTPALTATLAPLVGTLLRTRREAVGA
jgi:Tfp pilus assembly PilM family ATPase